MRHLPTHTDERNFHCEVCNKSFRQLSTLSQHRAIHSNDRPYSCEVSWHRHHHHQPTFTPKLGVDLFFTTTSSSPSVSACSSAHASACSTAGYMPPQSVSLFIIVPKVCNLSNLPAMAYVRRGRCNSVTALVHNFNAKCQVSQTLFINLCRHPDTHTPSNINTNTHTHLE